MTVASLWSALDQAGCGKAVGAREMTNFNNVESLIHPRNYDKANDTSTEPRNRPALAVDLSIWICEGLTSQSMAENHVNPVLFLVYSRTLRLLKMGIKLVVVIEGKRRIRLTGDENAKFHKRRGGTAFLRACKACEDMLRHMGVPVVRAKAEGEALCALLNQRGIVDGVISNDGDCLLFGAKIVFARFSIENLEKAQVIRYDACDLCGIVEEGEREFADNTMTADFTKTVPLSQHDLVSFAILTGSDLAGDGLPKVGHKKAIRFIQKCKCDCPLTPETAAIDELKSWARTAAIPYSANEGGKTRCCSHCSHPGDKRSHEKHGCAECGTEPGEPCHQVTTEDKFRKSLRTKALALDPKFDPVYVAEAYLNPNDNQIPICLARENAGSLQMGIPSLADMLRMPLIIKGLSFASSRDYIKQSLSKLLARATLFNEPRADSRNRNSRIRLSREQPIPIEINRRLVQNQLRCYELTWSVNATVTDGDGNGVDGFVFSTVEAQSLVEKKYPGLVQKFLELEKENQKQGDAEVNRRRSFLLKILAADDVKQADSKAHDHDQKRTRRRKNKRVSFFEPKRARIDPCQINKSMRAAQSGGEDVHNLMFLTRAASKNRRALLASTDEENSITSTETNSISTKEVLEDCKFSGHRETKQPMKDWSIPKEIQFKEQQLIKTPKMHRRFRKASTMEQTQELQEYCRNDENSRWSTAQLQDESMKQFQEEGNQGLQHPTPNRKRILDTSSSDDIQFEKHQLVGMPIMYSHFGTEEGNAVQTKELQHQCNDIDCRWYTQRQDGSMKQFHEEGGCGLENPPHSGTMLPDERSGEEIRFEEQQLVEMPSHFDAEGTMLETQELPHQRNDDGRRWYTPQRQDETAKQMHDEENRRLQHPTLGISSFSDEWSVKQIQFEKKKLVEIPSCCRWNTLQREDETAKQIHDEGNRRPEHPNLSINSFLDEWSAEQKTQFDQQKFGEIRNECRWYTPQRQDETATQIHQDWNRRMQHPTPNSKSLRDEWSAEEIHSEKQKIVEMSDVHIPFDPTGTAEQTEQLLQLCDNDKEDCRWFALPRQEDPMQQVYGNEGYRGTHLPSPTGTLFFENRIAQDRIVDPSGQAMEQPALETPPRLQLELPVLTTPENYRHAQPPYLPKLPALTPGNYHNVTCDMGLSIEITPLIPRRQF